MIAVPILIPNVRLVAEQTTTNAVWGHLDHSQIEQNPERVLISEKPNHLFLLALSGPLNPIPEGRTKDAGRRPLFHTLPSGYNLSYSPDNPYLEDGQCPQCGGYH